MASLICFCFLIIVALLLFSLIFYSWLLLFFFLSWFILWFQLHSSNLFFIFGPLFFLFLLFFPHHYWLSTTGSHCLYIITALPMFSDIWSPSDKDDMMIVWHEQWINILNWHTEHADTIEACGTHLLSVFICVHILFKTFGYYCCALLLMVLQRLRSFLPSALLFHSK